MARKTGQQSLPVDVSIALCLFPPAEGAARYSSFIHSSSSTNYLLSLVLERTLWKTQPEASKCFLLESGEEEDWIGRRVKEIEEER